VLPSTFAGTQGVSFRTLALGGVGRCPSLDLVVSGERSLENASLDTAQCFPS
jgi:hypothetical protein